MKVIAVFEKPKSCFVCPCHEEAGNYGNCKIIKRYIGNILEKQDFPDWCPLRPYIKVDATVNDIGVSPMLYALVVNDFMKHLTGETE